MCPRLSEAERFFLSAVLDASETTVSKVVAQTQGYTGETTLCMALLNVVFF